MASKYLAKWRPGFVERLERVKDDGEEEKKENGIVPATIGA